MANPDSPYLTQQWSGITHYICPRCGYNTFDIIFLDHHRCLPMARMVEESPVLPPQASEPRTAPAKAAAAPPTKGA